MGTSQAPLVGWTGIEATARRVRPHALPIAITLVLVLPLIVACMSLRAEEWAPIYDMALIEQRVRDVGTTHTPLVGLPGRLGTAEEPASHPGPLAFYLLAPGYRLFGASAWSLYVSGALVNAVAIALYVFVAWRPRSVAVLCAASTGFGVLMLGYGPTVLCEPWNPYFAVLWFAVFLIVVWSVACGDLAMLPLAAATASLTAQTSIPYLAVCGMLGAVCAAVTVVTTLRATPGSPDRKRGLRSLLIAAGIVFVAWLPPLIEELHGDPGNLTLLVRYFGDVTSVPLGLVPALTALLHRLDARSLVVDPFIAAGGFARSLYPPVPGSFSGVTLALWIVSALGALALRKRALWTLHGVALLSFVVAVVAASRIVGPASPHVILWSWTIGMLMLVASAATLWVLFADKFAALRSRLAALPAALGLLSVALPALRLAVAAGKETRPASLAQGRLVSAVARETISAIQPRRGLANGRSGRYLVSWSDALHGAALGIALGNELERAGFEVAYDRDFVLAGRHRTRDPAWATARLHFAVGGWIAEGRNLWSAVLAARVDTRPPALEREAWRLQAYLTECFRRAGREDLVRLMPYDLAAAVEPRIDKDWLIGLVATRLTEIGWPAAVFVLPPYIKVKRRLTLP
jgi:hypothetical protein